MSFVIVGVLLLLVSFVVVGVFILLSYIHKYIHNLHDNCSVDKVGIICFRFCVYAGGFFPH